VEEVNIYLNLKLLKYNNKLSNNYNNSQQHITKTTIRLIR